MVVNTHHILSLRHYLKGNVLETKTLARFGRSALGPESTVSPMVVKGAFPFRKILQHVLCFAQSPPRYPVATTLHLPAS
jgi:hypothetical protein